MNKKLEEDLVGYLLQACATLRDLTDRIHQRCRANPSASISTCSPLLVTYCEYLSTYLGKLAESIRRAVRKDRKALHETIRRACAHLNETDETCIEIRVLCGKEDKHG